MCIYRVDPFMDGERNPQDPANGNHSLTTEPRNANFKTVIFHGCLFCRTIVDFSRCESGCAPRFAE